MYQVPPGVVNARRNKPQSSSGPITRTFGNRTGADIAGIEDAVLSSAFADTVYSNEPVANDIFLLRFTGLGSIPSSATINDAFLTFYVTSGGGVATFSIARVLRNWVEGQATYNSFATSNAWGSPGAASSGVDYAATTSCELDYTGGFATGNFATINNTQLIADIQGFVSGSLVNNGWRIPIAGIGIGLPGDNDDATRRPMLTVTYTA